MSLVLAEIMGSLANVLEVYSAEEGLTATHQYAMDALTSPARAQHVVYSDITKQIEAWEGDMTREGVM